MRSRIGDLDLALDPIKQFAGNDPDDAIRKACKKLFLDMKLISPT